MLESIQAASTNRLWVAAPQHLLNIAEFEFDRKLNEILETMKKAIRTGKKQTCVFFFVKRWASKLRDDYLKWFIDWNWGNHLDISWYPIGNFVNFWYFYILISCVWLSPYLSMNPGIDGTVPFRGFDICQAGMKAEHLVLMGHSLGAVQCQLYLSHGPGVGKFDALILTGSALLRKYRNSSASDFRWFSGAGEAFFSFKSFCLDLPIEVSSFRIGWPKWLIWKKQQAPREWNMKYIEIYNNFSTKICDNPPL